MAADIGDNASGEDTLKRGAPTLPSRKSLFARHFDGRQYSRPLRCFGGVDFSRLVPWRAGSRRTDRCWIQLLWIASKRGSQRQHSSSGNAQQLRFCTALQSKALPPQRCRPGLPVSISGWGPGALRAVPVDLWNSGALRAPALLAARLDVSTSRTKLVPYPAPLEIYRNLPTSSLPHCTGAQIQLGFVTPPGKKNASAPWGMGGGEELNPRGGTGFAVQTLLGRKGSLNACTVRRFRR
jgi:hypothetical protein